MCEVHPDRKSYEKIWNKIISKEIENYQNVFANCIELIPDPKEEIWETYVRLNAYCKENYMKEPNDKIDRHKVAACYIIAIATVRPLRFVKKVKNERPRLAINESLAITVGLSLLRAFILAETKEMDGEEKIDILKKFEGGILIPDGTLIKHGSYMENYAREIFFAVSDGKACILSFAHELYLLEIFTRLGGVSGNLP